MVPHANYTVVRPMSTPRLLALGACVLVRGHRPQMSMFRREALHDMATGYLVLQFTLTVVPPQLTRVLGVGAIAS